MTDRDHKATKAYPLRIPIWLYEQIERAAAQELAGLGVSVNVEMVMLLREALEQRIKDGRLVLSDEDIEALVQAA